MLLRPTLLCLLLLTAATVARAQNKQSPTPTAVTTLSAPNTAQQTSANEDFELNISERRITERDYEASTEVATGKKEDGVNVGIGVGIKATSIDAHLRNVRGRVRFRAKLEPVLQRLNRRRADAPTAQ